MDVRALRAQLAGDLTAAMTRVAEAAEDRDELRRALVATLAHLYAWREHERREYEKRTGRSIRGLADTGDEGGLMVEGLLVWRALAEHHPEQMVELRVLPVFPGDDLFPSEWLFPGENLCLVEQHEIPPHIRDSRSPAAAVFRSGLSGRPVLPALSAAVHYLSRLNSLDE